MSSKHTKEEISRAQRAAKDAVSRGSKTIVTVAPKGFAVGGNGNGCGCKPGSPFAADRRAYGDGCSMLSPTSVNRCYVEAALKHGCPLKAIGGGIRGLAAGTSDTIVITPDLSNFFLPIAIRATIRDAAVPGTQLVGRFTSVTINRKPQEIYDDPTPLATSVGGVEINGYAGKTGTGESYGLPAYEVAWGPFSRDSMAQQLRIVAINDDPALAAIVHVDIWGFPIDALPDGFRCGVHPSSPEYGRDAA